MDDTTIAQRINRTLPIFGIHTNRRDRVSPTLAKWMRFLDSGDDRGFGVPVRLCAPDVFAAERLGLVETFMGSGAMGPPARFRLTTTGRDVLRS